MSRRVIASIEARMGASRLPGKVLMDLAGRPALGRMLDRVRQAETLDDIVIATSTAPADDAVAAWAEAEGVTVHRGSEDNVLERVLQAHRFMDSDVIVELCGDCPLIDPGVIDIAVERFAQGDCDIVTTTAPQSYPEGLDVEVFSRASLEVVAGDHGDDPEVREHVSIAFYRDRERWKLVSLRAPEELHRPEVRLLLDWPQDVVILARLIGTLEAKFGPDFTTRDVLLAVDAMGVAPVARQVDGSRTGH